GHADRIWAANAALWEPPRRFTFVRTGPDYVPAGRLGGYLLHLLDACVEPGGRLVLGTYNEEHDADAVAEAVAAAGLRIAGRASREHRHPALRYKVLWIDAD
ncbi:MAG: hypothetical protein HOQ22_04080, partial [Nocardioidaceae bacterium]|nr:hypothetical protein [Nocardioidaceae bacterium]